MERILVPLDNSPLAEAILPIVRGLARDDGALVVLLRAITPRHDAWEAASGEEVQAVSEAEKELRLIAARLEGWGVKRVGWEVRHDEPVSAIREAVKTHQADLITMATHGRSGLSRLLLGSVAQGVVGSVSVPTLLIRGRLNDATWSLKKLLVPLNGSVESEAILPVVSKLAGPADLELHLTQVLEPIPTAMERFPGEEEFLAVRRADAEQYLGKVAEGLRVKGLRVSWSVRAGTPAPAITAGVGEIGVDLIAMATHGWGLLGRLVFGSVADQVLRSASVPVLLLKAAGTDARTARR